MISSRILFTKSPTEKVLFLAAMSRERAQSREPFHPGSQYKHNNTKFLVARTPNGAICFISPLYVGSISGVELTRTSGFLDKLQDKLTWYLNNISIILWLIDLNILPFMQVRHQLPQQEIQGGGTIASSRIHVEKAIGRTYNVCKITIPLCLAQFK